MAKVDEDDGGVAPKWWKQHHNWTAIGTVVVGVFTVLLVLVGGLQYCVLNRTDETQRIIQSAFVIPRTIEVEGLEKRLKDGMMQWNISVSWENTGNTATRDLTIYTAWLIKNGNVDPPPEYPSADPSRAAQPGDMNILLRKPPTVVIEQANWPKPANKTLLGPHQSRFVNQMSFPATSMQRLQNGAATLAVVGLATYEDQFAKRHVTMFCQNVVVPAIDYLQGEANRAFVTKNPDCDEYNCSDEDCKKYKSATWLPEANTIP